MVINLHFMKSLKPTFISVLHGLLICSILTTGACKKEKKPVPWFAKTLVGHWGLTDKGPNTETHLYFGGLGEFTYTFVHYDNGLADQTSYNGTYTTQSGNLTAIVKEKVEQKGNNPAVKTVSSITFYDNVPFKLDGDILTLKLVTYPADAPILTEFKFYRQLPD